MFLIGDVHGNFNRYHNFCKKLPESLQLGDMGVGFPDESKSNSLQTKVLTRPKSINLNHKFICGNHDDYQYASTLPNCLGRFGYIEESGIFYISGGFSIDKQYRTPGINWWPSEQLDANEMIQCMALYKKVRPEAVCSHECPTVAKYWSLFYSGKNKGFSSRRGYSASYTEMLLNDLYVEHAPKYWIHGHFHQFYTKEEGCTLFVGLDELISGKKENCIYEIKT